jgi:putative ABC transport system permease protein
VRLRDQLTSGARTILLVLMAAAVLVFVITVSNVANLILARTVRRENELSIRAALGATTLDLRRVLLAESLLLCAAGAAIGILIAQPMVALLAQYASRFSVRALDLTVDSSMLWVGAGLAMIAAALLAFVPLLPSSRGRGFWLAGASLRITGATNRRLKVFALVQIAACFLLVAVSAATVNTLVSLEAVRARFETYHVLAVNVPVMRDGRTPSQIVDYYREAVRQIRELPGVLNVALSTAVPWRDTVNRALEFSADGRVPAADEKRPHANPQGRLARVFRDTRRTRDRRTRFQRRGPQWQRARRHCQPEPRGTDDLPSASPPGFGWRNWRAPLWAAAVLLIAAVAASAIPALRAARVDVIQALRSE